MAVRTTYLVATVAALTLLGIVLIRRPHPEARIDVPPPPFQPPPAPAPLSPLKLAVPRGADLLWLPPARPALGLLMLFHGCTHSGEDWFALPEEVAIVRAALARGLAVAAPSSADRVSGCWDAAHDTPAVLLSLEALRPLVRTPVVLLLGASSGGTFATELLANRRANASGAVVIVSPGNEDALATVRAPVAFVHMTGDRRWATVGAVRDAVATLGARGVPARSWSCEPRAVTAELLAASIEGLGERRASDVVKVAKKLGLLGVGQREGDVARRVVAELARSGSEGEYWRGARRALEEVLNAAEGVHEMTREHVPEAVDWLMSLN